jgi:hypothetical protein
LEGFAQQPGFEVLELAFRAPARELAAFKRRDARGIVGAILEALERIDELRRRRLLPDHSDNAAHLAEKTPHTPPQRR